MRSVLDKRIFNLLQKRYEARDASIMEALNWIDNSQWLESRGFYETVSSDFYHKDRNIMVESKCLLNPPIALQTIVLRKEKEADEWARRKQSSN